MCNATLAVHTAELCCVIANDVSKTVLQPSYESLLMSCSWMNGWVRCGLMQSFSDSNESAVFDTRVRKKVTITVICTSFQTKVYLPVTSQVYTLKHITWRCHSVCTIWWIDIELHFTLYVVTYAEEASNRRRRRHKKSFSKTLPNRRSLMRCIHCIVGNFANPLDFLRIFKSADFLPSSYSYNTLIFLWRHSADTFRKSTISV